MTHVGIKGCSEVLQGFCGQRIARHSGFQVAGQGYVRVPNPPVSMAQHRASRVGCAGQWGERRLEPGEGDIGAVSAACMHFWDMRSCTCSPQIQKSYASAGQCSPLMVLEQ